MDTQATLQAQVGAYATEGAAMDGTVTAMETSVLATAYAVETRVYQANNVNEQLLGMVREIIPPTQAVSVGSGSIGALGSPVPADGQQSFVFTGMADRVRASDGCIENPQTTFSQDAQRIYATLKAFSLRAGTVMGAEWYREGERVWGDQWTVPRDASELCVWFYIEPSYVELMPGTWSVRLVANGAQIGNATPFTIIEAMSQ